MLADFQDTVDDKRNLLMEWIIPAEASGLHNGIGLNMHPKPVAYLEKNKNLFQDKVVLDLACHTGISSKILTDSGAKRVVGVDIRDDVIEMARDRCKQDSSVYFFTNDITNYGLIDALIAESNIVTCFGVLYHLTDNFTFLDHICNHDHIEYVVLETMFGTESPNAFMFPLFENTSMRMNGYHPKYSKVPICQPNLSWIYQALNQIGFKIDYIEKYYQSEKFDQMTDDECENNKRMILRLYNPKLVKKTDYLKFDDIWEWNEDQRIHQC